MVHKSDWRRDVFVRRNDLKLLFIGSTIYGEELSDVVAGIQVSVIFVETFGLDNRNGGSENEQWQGSGFAAPRKTQEISRQEKLDFSKLSLERARKAVSCANR